MLEIQKKLSTTFLAILSLPATAMGFALSIQIAALSWIMSTKYGLAIEEVGIVWAAGPIAGILGQVLIGIISDKVWFWGGRRRPFILIGGVIAAIMLFLLPRLDTVAETLGIEDIVTVAIIVAITLDLAINISFNPTRAVIADVTPEGEGRTKAYTWMQTISGAFGVLAYVIGASIDNYFLIYFGVGLVLLFSLIPTLLIKEPRTLEANAGNEGSESPNISFYEIFMTIRPLWGFLLFAVWAIIKRLGWVEVDHYYVEYISLAIAFGLIVLTVLQNEEGLSKSEAANVSFRKVLAAHSFTWLGIQTMFVYMYAYIQGDMGQSDPGQVTNIAFLVLNVVGFVLPVTLFQPMVKKLGRVKTHLLSLAAMAIGYFAIFIGGSSPVALYVMMGIVGIGWAATVSLPFAIISDKVDQRKMGLYMGIFNLSVVLPQLVASLFIGSLVAQAESKSIIFIIAGLSLAVSAALWMLIKDE